MEAEKQSILIRDLKIPIAQLSELGAETLRITLVIPKSWFEQPWKPLWNNRIFDSHKEYYPATKSLIP
ncbi:MAG: hypothetical protein V7L26_14735 [Nostoc sp.]|uniref:hypothetical protein n=1 Tax=Nostoc sp. TaxID=1180 RepID=UPI002FF0833F